MNIRPTFIFRPFRAFIENVGALYTDLSKFLTRYQYGVVSTAAIANGGTAGRFAAGASFAYRIGGQLYSKANTDNFWNLSGQTATTGSQYRAIYLYIDASGNASIGAGTNATTAALAIAALPAVPTDKSVIGCFVAGPSTNFANALSGQGTLYNGWPTTQSLTSEAVTYGA
jgi:hypothetical protein